MPTVSGRILFDINRNINPAVGVVGIANIPVALQNMVTLINLTVLTNTLGEFSFINVPAGSYRLVEAYGLSGGIPTPGDYAGAAITALPAARTPPVSTIPSAPPGATNIDCVSPNTILLTVAATDIIDQNIFNGPVAYLPLNTLLDPCATVLPLNLVTDADGGTFGLFATGTIANSGPPTNPYPTISPDFTYVTPDPSDFTPFDGEFTIQNTMNNAMSNVIGAWWRISDHTTGNETGRMMIMNEDDPGGLLFRTNVTVVPHTTYLFSTWIMNLFRVAGFPGPAFAVRILDEEGNALYDTTLGPEIPVNVLFPEWKEIGGVINSVENTQLTIEFYSQGEAAVGNDFVIDDIGFREIILPQYDLIKTEDVETAELGDVVTYTVSLSNTCQQPLTNVRFWDFIPNGLQFIPETVVINGMPNPLLNPLIGFPVPDILGGAHLVVSFRVRVIAVPRPNPAINRASIQYVYSPVPDGIEDIYTLVSNEVQLLVEEPEADLRIRKTVSCRNLHPGELAVFTVSVTNLGPDTASGVVISDAIPAGIANPEFTVVGIAGCQPWEGGYSRLLLAAGETITLRIKGRVSVCSGIIENTAVVTTLTPDPNPLNNSAAASICIRPRCGCNCGCG